MIIEKGKIVRFCIKGNYRIKEEIWKVDPTDPGTKMIQAYSDSGDYIGNPGFAKAVHKRFGIVKFEKSKEEHSVCSIGFSERDQKWYGWSHRAIYGFGIGSQVKKGDCAYVPSSPQELYDEVTEITCDPEDGFKHQWLKPEDVEITENGIRVREKTCKGIFNDEGVCVKLEPAEDRYWEIHTGKGEWTANTLEEARQMAIDFAESVS